MQSSNIPTKIPLPFAYNAGVGYKNTIPTASQIGVVNGRASLNDGFPPLNFVPISAGGVPPFGSDVNGILNEITAITQWQQAGGFFFYDSSFSTTIGGYPKGAILQSSSNSGLWISTAENNTTNPDTGGAGWMSLAFEGSQAITVTTADVTVTQLQSAYPVLIISGAKTAARSLIMPAIVGEWIIQNNTTGAFTLTAKTAAGTGVTLTQGESTFIYGDGTNILFADSSKVASFNGRVGTVTLNATDVTTALGYVPLGANLTGAITSVGNATTVVTNANLTGDVTSVGNATTLATVNYNVGAFTNASVTVNAKGLITAVSTGASFVPAGTRMPFAQAAAPTGWTQDITDNANNRMLRVVSSAGGGIGGSASPILNNVVSSHTHTFTGSALAAHTHTDSGHQHSKGAQGALLNGYQVNPANGRSESVNTGVGYANIQGASAGTPSGSISANGSASDWSPRYIDMIICAKD